MVEFRILGPLEVVRSGRVIGLGGPKQRATLAILLLSANRVVSIDRLADDLYAGTPPVTAVTQVQRQVSELRKLLGAGVIETRAPGYRLQLSPEQFDLSRFEELSEQAADALEGGHARSAADVLRNALSLWRGAPLADLAYEPFAQTAIARLDELRLAAIEQRIEAELVLGRHSRLLPELETLVWDHPLRERLRGQLILALYRSGRQADALDAYRRTREALVGELGIEPSKTLQELERRILKQDRTLDLPSPEVSTAAGERTLLIAASDEERLSAVRSVGEPLARLPERALLIVQVVSDEDEVAAAATVVNRLRSESVRTAAFASPEPARDLLRLALNYDVELVLLDEGSTADVAMVAERSPADVAVLYGGAFDAGRGSGVFVPFGGDENDWAALELGAWLAVGSGLELYVLGTRSNRRDGRRDASRLLADASLALQRLVGVPAQPVLTEPTRESLLSAVQPATVVVAGLPRRWRAEGLGVTRTALVEQADAPVLLVQRGMRPGGLAPGKSRTRFSWTLG